MSDQKLKYYYCGEYGGRTMRPHYHMLLFNSNHDDVLNAWVDPDKKKPIGSIHFGDVNGASVGYTLKYMMKPGKIPLHKNDDRIPEFSNMSKGLGLNYLTDSMIKYHKNDLESRVNITIEGGRKIAMPRYYKDKLYSEDEKEKIQQVAISEAEKRLEKLERDMFHQYGELYPTMVIQNHMDQFKKMYREAEKDRNKI